MLTITGGHWVGRTAGCNQSVPLFLLWYLFKCCHPTFFVFLRGGGAEAPAGRVGPCGCRAGMGRCKRRSGRWALRGREEATAPLRPPCGHTSLLPPDFRHFFWSRPGLWISEGVLSPNGACRVRMAGNGFSACLFIYLFPFSARAIDRSVKAPVREGSHADAPPLLPRPQGRARH